MGEPQARRIPIRWVAYWLALGAVNIAGIVLLYQASRVPFDPEGRGDLWSLLVVVVGWVLVDMVFALGGLYAISGPVGRAVTKFNLAVLVPITLAGFLFQFPAVFLLVGILAPLLLPVLAVGNVITLLVAQRRYREITT